MAAAREYVIDYRRADGSPAAVIASFSRPPDPVMLGQVLKDRGEDLATVYDVRAHLVHESDRVSTSEPYSESGHPHPAIIIIALVCAAALLVSALVF